MSNATMQDLEEKADQLAFEFRAYALKKLQKIEGSGVGVSQDHEENAHNWTTPRQFIAAAAKEYADDVISGKLTKKVTHNIHQYRIHM